MNKTVVKVIGIISLITFLLAMSLSIYAIIGGNNFFDTAAEAYNNYETASAGEEIILALIAIFGGSFFFIVGCAGVIYDLIAHVPALIAYLVGRKGNHATLYWIFISFWIGLMLGIPFFIIVF